MKKFKTKIEGCGDEEFEFECYENTEHISVEDVFILFFAGVADVQKCNSKKEEEEINQNDRKRDYRKIDLVTGFWRNCYKIKNTNFDLTKVQ